MPSRTLRCSIEQVASWYPQFFLEPHIVACAAVMARYSDSPATFGVECREVHSRWLRGEGEFSLDVGWSEETRAKADRLRATIQSKPLIEMAATAIALVLAHRVLQLEQLDVTEYGDRADYRSPKRQCLLEISGTEALSELVRRQKAKAAQAMANPLRWDAYVIVCAFSAEGHRIRLSHHGAP